MDNGSPLVIPLPSGRRNWDVGTGLELAAFASLVGLFAWALAIDNEVSLRVSDAAAQLPTVTSWSVARFEPTMWVGIFAWFIAFLLRNAKVSGLRLLGWSVFGVCLATMAALNVYSLRHYSGGIATAEKAIFLNARGETIERAWNSADVLFASCGMGRRGTLVRYQIGFDGQVAALEQQLRLPATQWIEMAGIVNAKLPPRIRVSRKAFEWRCFEAETIGLPIQGKIEFLRLFRPTSKHAARFARESETWAQIALQAVRQPEGASIPAKRH